MQNSLREDLEQRNRNTQGKQQCRVGSGEWRRARDLDQKEMCLSRFLFGQNTIKLFQEYSRKPVYLIQHVTGSGCIVQTYVHSQYLRHWVRKVIIPPGVPQNSRRWKQQRGACKEVLPHQVELEARHVPSISWRVPGMLCMLSK